MHEQDITRRQPGHHLSQMERGRIAELYTTAAFINIGVYASRSSITLLRFKVPLSEKYMLPKSFKMDFVISIIFESIIFLPSFFKLPPFFRFNLRFCCFCFTLG